MPTCHEVSQDDLDALKDEFQKLVNNYEKLLESKDETIKLLESMNNIQEKHIGYLNNFLRVYGISL